MRPVYVFAFIWMVIVGGLMITNLGVFCIACSAIVNKLAAVISIVVGLYGLYGEFKGTSAQVR